MSDAEEEYDYLLTPQKQRIFVGKLPDSQILTTGKDLSPISKRISSFRHADIIKYKCKNHQDLENVIYLIDNLLAIHIDVLHLNAFLNI